MRLPPIALAACLAVAPLTAAAQSAPADHGAKVYQRCAACHLPNGHGVPGAFPALAGRVDKAALNDAGRDYLVMAISAGLVGEIDVDGRKIRGVMPAQAGLTDADIAAVLNYTITLKDADAPHSKTPPRAFTAEEVAAIRARFVNANPNAVHAIRAGVFEATPAVVDGEK